MVAVLSPRDNARNAYAQSRSDCVIRRIGFQVVVEGIVPVGEI
jgi:hypothetical protein